MLFNKNARSIFHNFWSHFLFLRFRRSTQLCSSTWPCSTISSNPLPTLLEPEGLFLNHSIPMSLTVQQCVDYTPSTFSLHHFTSTASKCFSEFNWIWASLKCILILAPSKTPGSHDAELNVYLQALLIMESKWISESTQSWPRSASPECLFTASKCISLFNSMSGFKCISKCT